MLHREQPRVGQRDGRLDRVVAHGVDVARQEAARVAGQRDEHADHLATEDQRRRAQRAQRRLPLPQRREPIDDRDVLDQHVVVAAQRL